MANPSPSLTNASSLIASGTPFLPFPTFSILELQPPAASEGGPTFSEWLTKRLQLGQPVVIKDFDKLPVWDNDEFGVERLIELSTKKSGCPPSEHSRPISSFEARKFLGVDLAKREQYIADIPIRNCSTGRDL